MSPDETHPVSTSILGTGWSFPPTFVGDDRASAGQVVMTSDEEDIAGSLRILFGTRLGERFLRPKFGLDMHEMLFEALSTTTKTYLEDRIRTSIAIYEPRIRLLSLVLDDGDANAGVLKIVVDYEVRATNSRYNLVYPFYTSDGSEVKASLGSSGV